jgi:hypothetical protein
MKKIINPKGFSNTNLKTESIISKGLDEYNTIIKYNSEATPKIMKKKSALMVHKKISIIKINNTESINSISLFEKKLIK